MNENHKLQKEIVFSLYRRGYFGKKHTPINNLCKRLSHYSCKKIRREIKILIKREIILPKPTAHDPDIRLNVRMKKEIEFFIKDRIEELYDF